jgi:hypothetical protein
MSRARPERALDKLIVRWLPSKLTEEEFRLSVGKWQESITWLRFEAGTVPEGVGGQRPTPGCAYLQIRNPEVAADLSMALDGAGYRDSAGMMCRCMVEWAPCQRVPVKSREDSRAGSLEQDEVYKAFVDDLTKEKPPPLSAEAALEAREKEKAKREGEVVVTPLLQYLKDKQQRAAAKKAKDMRGKQATALKERQEKLLVAQREARSKAQEQRLAKKAERKVGGEKKVLATAALVKAAMEEAAHESAERKGKGKGGKGAGKGREARAAEQVAAYPPLVVDGCCARARAPHARARTCSAHTPHMLRTHAAHAPHTRRTCSAHTPHMLRTHAAHAPHTRRRWWTTAWSPNWSRWASPRATRRAVCGPTTASRRSRSYSGSSSTHPRGAAARAAARAASPRAASPRAAAAAAARGPTAPCTGPARVDEAGEGGAGAATVTAVAVRSRLAVETMWSTRPCIVLLSPARYHPNDGCLPAVARAARGGGATPVGDGGVEFKVE